ncbi:CocE/NonD family hydrolase [Nocardiopsis sp. NRRL B-16309]|uniref:CocE/NonD family hydrolase n=1 Tax=Nocardiopsis sp. NRRL B-16309 TaxID=1519494 RepID=UPI0006B01E79|nr:CocE/NonD family hydrolase [Nocardiopsis sp. NRRL B-16309]
MLTIERTGPAAVPPDATEITIPMRDGVLLAADLYRAGTGAPGPVVLVRLPYDKDGAYCFMPDIARRFRARGYTVVVQDVRGKFRSQGATEFAVHEADDGHDTIEWITRRPWCDGDVLMWGDSYYGYTAIAAAMSGHPALRAIAPRVTGSQLSTVLDHGDGTRDVEQTSRKLYFATHYVDADRYEWEPDWSRRPLAAGFEAFFDRLGKRSPAFDDEFGGDPRFVPPPLKSLLASPPVPALYTIGWFDNCAVWSWHDVRALSRDPGWAPHLYLRLEAIDHENHWLGDAPIAPGDDHATDPGARERLLPRYIDPAIAFFDAVLGRSGDLAALPRVRYEVCHGAWHESDAWPPAHASDLEYHLCAGPVRRLAAEPDPEPRRLRWVGDPADPVPSPGANPFAALADRADLSAVAERPDVLRFTGPAAERDTDLVGTATVHLPLRAGAGATVHARLLDTAPDGGAELIARGQLRLDVPFDREPVVVDLLEVAYRLRSGHRLALDLMGGDFPDFVPEGRADEPWTAPAGPPTAREITVGGPSGARLRIGRRQPEDLRRSGPR